MNRNTTTARTVRALPPGAAAPILLPAALLVALFPAAARSAPATAPAVAPAATTAPTEAAGPESPGPAEIDSLIAQLGDADWHVRQRARGRLVDVGEPARAALRRAATGEGPAGAAAGVRLEAQTALAELDDPLRPSMVTLHVKDAPVEQVLAAVTKQTGIGLDLYQEGAAARARGTRITLDADRKPFWEVMRPLCAAIDVRPDCRLPETRTLSLRQDEGAWAEPFTAAQGPFAIGAATVYQRKSADFSLQQDPMVKLRKAYDEEVHVQLFAHAEPRLLSAYLAGLVVQSCVDENGHDLGARGGHAITPAMARGYTTVEVEVPATRDSRRIASLKATATFIVATKQEVLDLPEAVREKRVVRTIRRSDGPLTLIFHDLRKTEPDQYAATVTVERGPRDDAAFFACLDQLKAAPPELRDEKGRLIELPGEPQLLYRPADPTRADLELGFRGGTSYNHAGIPTEPTRFIWAVPTEIKTISFPFELKDIPLP